MRCFFATHKTRTTSTPQNTVDYKSIVVIQDVREPKSTKTTFNNSIESLQPSLL